MGTKNNPGKFDCYAAAAPDEPIFTFKAMDPLASIFVTLYAAVRTYDQAGARAALEAAYDAACTLPVADREKMAEARQCAEEMLVYRRKAARAKKEPIDPCMLCNEPARCETEERCRGLEPWP